MRERSRARERLRFFLFLDGGDGPVGIVVHVGVRLAGVVENATVAAEAGVGELRGQVRHTVAWRWEGAGGRAGRDGARGAARVGDGGC